MTTYAAKSAWRPLWGRFLTLAALSAFASCSDGLSAAPVLESVEVDAPFDMPPILTPDFADCPEFVITRYGAKVGDQDATSQGIAQAIAAAHDARGGVVVVPAGEWDTRKIHLKSNVELHLRPGAVLRFSPDPHDYLPAVETTWEGMECYNYSPLVYGYGCENIAITGDGELQADLAVWREWYSRPTPHLEALKRLYEQAAAGTPVRERQMAVGEAHLRPQFVQFNRCENVRVEGVTIRNSPFWVIHPFLCNNVVIRGVKVNARGHNNDGVDPEMSQNVLIEDCDFNQGDDAISVKSGRNQDAWRLAHPAKNIVIRNCRVQNGHQLLAIGSELSGGVENVLVENCHVDKSITGVGHLLYIKTNERRGGYARNIYMRDVSAGDLRYGVLGIETDVLYQWRNLVPTHEVRLTPIEAVHIERVRVGEVRYMSKIEGQEELPVRNVSLADVTAQRVRGQAIRNSNTEGFHFEESLHRAQRDAGTRPKALAPRTIDLK